MELGLSDVLVLDLDGVRMEKYMQQQAGDLPIVIVGSGMAAYFLVQAIREVSPDQAVVILCKHDGRFYPKPMLSSALYHKKTLADIVTASADEMVAKYNIQIINFACVQSINPQDCVVHYTVADQQKSLLYAKLVLATGSKPKKLTISGGEQIRQVNDIEAYEQLSEHLFAKKRVAVIGSGLIGVEFAHDLAYAGHQVSVFSQTKVALSGLVPEFIGQRVTTHLQGMGVEWINTAGLDSCAKHVDGLLLRTQESIEKVVDIALAAIGIQANTDIEIAGIEKNKNGYICDNYARTNLNNIFAIGDCACIAGLHLTYVAPIKQQVKALSKTLLNDDTPVMYPAMPVVVKMPTLPLTLVPVRGDISGAWRDEVDEPDRAVSAYYDDDNVLRGFVLCHEATQDRAAWLDKMPQLL